MLFRIKIYKIRCKYIIDGILIAFLWKVAQI